MPRCVRARVLRRSPSFKVPNANQALLKSVGFLNELKRFQPAHADTPSRTSRNENENGDGDVRIETFYFFFNKSKHKPSLELLHLGGS